MNILFHLAAGFGIVIVVCDSKAPSSNVNTWYTAAIGMVIAFVSHGLLDYAPHCYPINSKVDFVIGGILLLLLSSLAKGKYKLILFSTLIGSVLPDIIDLFPSILNKQLNFSFPTYNKIFPWHWKKYSGSIYNDDCNTSNVNISLLFVSVLGIIVLKWKNLKWMYFK